MACSRNVVIKPDVAFADAVKKDYDVVVCPGGLKGAEHLAKVSIFVIILFNFEAFVYCKVFYTVLIAVLAALSLGLV